MKKSTMQKKASINPLKGFRDFTPEEWRIQQYIFDVWRRVCMLYGYDEYSGPVLERAEIYEKSGDDVGTQGKELFRFVDKGGRDIAMRPEMTPTVGRMLAKYGSSYQKPVRWFSIEQFFRAEKPQRGRGREFYQLNYDIFGDESVLSDFEILSLSIDIMVEFGADKSMFLLRYNNRKFTDYYFENILNVSSNEMKTKLLRIVDSSLKKGEDWVKMQINSLAGINYEDVKRYLSLTIQDIEMFSEDSEGAREIIALSRLLDTSGKSGFCRFDTTIARGFDYYTGMVFEVFDKGPKNNRSMYGGGRYDDLLDIFGKPRLPAVGCAPGDMTLRLFLEEWGLLPQVKESKNKVLVSMFDEGVCIEYGLKVADILRKNGIIVEVYFPPADAISKQLRYANKRAIPYVIIIGQDEIKKSKIVLKNMDNGEQNTLTIDEAVKKMSN